MSSVIFIMSSNYNEFYNEFSYFYEFKLLYSFFTLLYTKISITPVYIREFFLKKKNILILKMSLENYFCILHYCIQKYVSVYISNYYTIFSRSKCKLPTLNVFFISFNKYGIGRKILFIKTYRITQYRVRFSSLLNV